MQTFRDDDLDMTVEVDGEMVVIDKPSGAWAMSHERFDALYGLMQKAHHYGLHGETL